MSLYVEQAIQSIDQLPFVTRQILNTIEELDELGQEVCENIDGILTGRVESKEATTVQSLSAVAEDIAEKKTLLALRNYDLIDQHIKILDKKIEFLNTIIRRRGPPDAHKLEVSDSDVDGTITSDESFPHNAKKRKRFGMDVLTSSSHQSAEPVYCTCRQVAFGEMIACDNDDCKTEWFHYTCVGLTKKPKNLWYCSACKPLFH